MGSENETSRLTRIWNSICYQIGYKIAKYAGPTIILCLLISTIMSIKLALTEKISAIDGYATDDSMSRYEFKVFQQFLDTDGPGITMAVLIRSKDNGSLLIENRLEEVVKVSDLISTRFKMNVSGVEKNFNQFCRGFCQANDPVRQYYNGLQLLSKNNTDRISRRIDLSYPTSNFFGRKFSLIPNFFGIKLSDDGKSLNASNLIVLYFRAERFPDWTTRMVKKFETDVRHYFDHQYQNDQIIVEVMSQTIVENEIVRAGMSLQPFIGVGFVIMSIFCTTTTMISAVFFYSQKATFRKVALSIIACITPFMACGTAFGIMFFCGFIFSPIMCITPFLVLAISVDDSFLMIHAWNRIESWRSVEPLTREQRQKMMGTVLVETGPAITISALTNILAFTVGAYTSPPEIRIFCYGNAAAIFMDMFYQATFYTACMTLLADEKADDVGDTIRKIQIRISEITQKFLSVYVNLIANIFVSTFIVLLWLIFIGFAILGLTRLHVELSPSKFFLKDSPMLKLDRLRTSEVIPHYIPVTVVVNNPGDLTNDSVIEKLMEMKSKLENIPYAIGPKSTNFFLNDFVQYQNSFIEELEMQEEEGFKSNKTEIEQFLEWPEFSYWRGFLRLENDTSNALEVKKFMFTTGFHGDELKDWAKRDKLLKSWRRTVEQYKKDFNATVFSEDAFFLDMIDTIPTITWQTTLATFIFVSLVCFLFISHIPTVVIVSIAILVTSIGVFGYLSLFGVTLDPVIMSIAIMCIGFSVDIPAHVAFHFYAAKANKNKIDSHQPDQVSSTSTSVIVASSKKSLEEDQTSSSYKKSLSFALSSVGFPVIQAGVSTDFCALPLGFMELYMARMFAASLTLCVTFSLIHGLVIIPALLSIQNTLSKLLRKMFSRN